MKTRLVDILHQLHLCLHLMMSRKNAHI
jgi:hypothetical protein